MDINDEQVMATLREVVAERPDYVYAAPAHNVEFTGQCKYVHTDADGSNKRPGCLVGHVLHRLGVPLGTLDDIEGEPIGDVGEDLGIPVRAVTILSAAQGNQDCGSTWGDALAAALGDNGVAA